MIQFLSMWQRWVAHTRFESNRVLVHSRSLHHACRIWLVARNTSLHRYAFFYVDETQLQLSTVSGVLSLSWLPDIRNLTASRGGVDAKKFAHSSSVLLRFFTFFATNRQQISGDRSPPLFVSTHLVLITS